LRPFHLHTPNTILLRILEMASPIVEPRLKVLISSTTYFQSHIMSGSCHIRRVEIVVELGIFVFFEFSAEQKSDLKEYKSLFLSFEALSILS
jgi:hypothetical protein